MTPGTREAGFTLVELMIAITIMGILFVGVFAGMATFLKSTVVQRSTADLDKTIRAYAERLIDSSVAYQPCPNPSYVGPGAGQVPEPAGYAVAVTAKYWDGTSSGNSFTTACPAPDKGVQQTHDHHHEEQHGPATRSVATARAGEAGIELMATSLRSEAGFTLVELLVGLVILGIIGAALTSALFLGVEDVERHADEPEPEQRGTCRFGIRHQGHSSDVPARHVHTPAQSAGPACNAVDADGNEVVNGGIGNGSFVIWSLAVPTLPRAGDVSTTYTLNAGQLTRQVLGPANATKVIAENVECLRVVTAGSGACAGQFELDVTVAGSSAGIGTAPYSFSVCAKARAG